MNKAIKFVCALGFGAVACFGGYFTGVYNGADGCVRVEDINGFVSSQAETAKLPVLDFGADISNAVNLSDVQDSSENGNAAAAVNTELTDNNYQSETSSLIQDKTDNLKIPETGSLNDTQNNLELININLADAAAFETLPGIGPALQRTGHWEEITVRG